MTGEKRQRGHVLAPKILGADVWLNIWDYWGFIVFRSRGCRKTSISVRNPLKPSSDFPAAAEAVCSYRRGPYEVPLNRGGLPGFPQALELDLEGPAWNARRLWCHRLFTPSTTGRDRPQKKFGCTGQRQQVLDDCGTAAGRSGAIQAGACSR